MTTMQKYRKKPVTIEAWQFNGQDRDDWPEYIREYKSPDGRGVDYAYDSTLTKPCLVIPTLEGDHTADLGDWIIKGVEGELYPCKPGIFAKTYEPAP